MYHALPKKEADRLKKEAHEVVPSHKTADEVEVSLLRMLSEIADENPHIAACAAFIVDGSGQIRIVGGSEGSTILRKVDQDLKAVADAHLKLADPIRHPARERQRGQL